MLRQGPMAAMMAHAPLPAASSAPLYAEAVWRRGQAALRVALLAGMALALAVAWWRPELSLLLPSALLALGAGAWLFRRPVLNFAVLLTGFAVTLQSDHGIQPVEVLYGLYYYAFLLYWYGGRLLRRERFVWTNVDRALALLIVFGVGGGVALGLLFGADLGFMRGEATSFAMLSLYFPAKEFCRQERYGPEVLLLAFVWIGVFVAARNFLNFREIILSATEEWQVADARPGLNEMQLLIPAFGALVALLFERSRGRALAILALFLLLLAALVMTKARGYWIDFAFGTLVLFFLLHGRQRWRLVLFVGLGSLALVTATLVFLGPLAELVFSGTLYRFSTLETAATQDPSLVNRFIETRAVWEGIKRNPVLGYGFGTTFTYFDINFLGTKTKSFMHNGYVALWFKLGLWGLVLMLFAWAASARDALRVYRDPAALPRHRILGLIIGLNLIAIIPSVNTSNPFPLIDTVYTFGLLLATACGLHQRYSIGGAGARPAPRTEP